MDSFGDHASAALTTIDTTEIPADVNLVLEQQVHSGDALVDQYHVVVRGGTVKVEAGPAENPDMILRQDVETATALREGTLHAQNAFLTGRLSIDGDINALLEHGPLLARLLPGLGV